MITRIRNLTVIMLNLVYVIPSYVIPQNVYMYINDYVNLKKPALD